ncbi:MAG: DUF3450 domain-containing protein [Oscillospiraceae bacterium]|nr:DUF3450 domain-containing protein [Oscillospiraceae bacterium]
MMGGSKSGGKGGGSTVGGLKGLTVRDFRYVALCVAVAVLAIIQVVSGTPGGAAISEDELVPTVAYVNKQIGALQDRMDALTRQNEDYRALVDELTKAIGALRGGDDFSTRLDRIEGVNTSIVDTMRDIYDQYQKLIKAGSSSQGGSAQPSGESAYAFIVVAAGKTIRTGEGTEIIVRSGAAVGLVGSAGLANVTTGTDLGTREVTIDHLLVSAKNDGRGIRVTRDAGILIRGPYTIG